MSKKPISIVKNVLYRNCSLPIQDGSWIEVAPNNHSTTFCDWAPFDQPNHKELLGSLDLAFLFSYAFGMFFSGHIAERMNLRYFLSGGMILVGIMTAAFGMGYFINIHNIYFFVIVQIISGLVQSTGWPSVVACVGNWYGKGKRGFIMGVWNSHTSVGNILGSLIAGAFVTSAWGWSFVVPGLITIGVGIIVFLFLVPDPADVGCDMPDQHGEHVVAEHAPIQRTLTVEAPDSVDDENSEKQPLQRNEGYSSEDEPYMQQSYTGIDASTKALIKHQNEKPITIWGAFLIPGVAEFSLCLFCAKLVSYTFLFWLPNYIEHTAHFKSDAEKSADISTLFDVGGIVGGILAGVISDYYGGRATTCAVMLIIAAPVMYVYNLYGGIDVGNALGLSFLCGLFVNGPYALITTAVSADLGTHKILEGNSKALATVTAVIDGTGSIGAAIGPLLAGLIPVWNNVFIMLIVSDLCALIFLVRLVYKELRIGQRLGCTGD